MNQIVLSIIGILFFSIVANAQIFRVAEMNVEQIKKLDKERTAVILPGGIIEEHGSYLPTFTDGYWNEQVTRELAKQLRQNRAGQRLYFRQFLSVIAARTTSAGNFLFRGTYAVRFETLRSIFMDLATELGEQKFKWIFIVHGHGAPNHVRALDQAGDYFRDTYGGRMVNLTGLLPVVAVWDAKKSEAQRKEDGLPIHAGMDETSMVLFLRPDLVNPNYKNAKPFASDKMEELITIAQSKDWLGYFGSPRLASREQYANGWQIALNEAVNLGMKILDGLDDRTIPRFGDEMLKSPSDVALDNSTLRHEAEIERKQNEWLKRKKFK